MNAPSISRERAPRRYTGATLTIGVVIAGACFVVALLAELAGVTAGAGDMTDVGAIVDGLLALTPWAWAALGTWVVVLTPAAGLLVTAWEYASVSDRRTVALAIAVVAVLTASALVSLLR